MSLSWRPSASSAGIPSASTSDPLMLSKAWEAILISLPHTFQRLYVKVKEEFAKSYREGDKAKMVHGGGNEAGRFLEVSVLTEGGRKGVISLPEGRFGRGWRRFAGELR
jgi:hypothetical protein